MIRLLEPWFLAPGVLAAAVVTALHFLARSPVRRAPLPTLRFLSPAQHTAVRMRRRPHDLLLLALRVLFALSLAAAFAGPVWTATAVDRGRILLLDRGAGMTGAWNAAVDSVAARLGGDPLMVIVFDTVAVVALRGEVDVAWINELRNTGPSDIESHYRIAFHALAREAGRVAADTYEAILVTVPRWSAWRDGTSSVRAAAWPGRLDVVVPGPVGSPLGSGLPSAEPARADSSDRAAEPPPAIRVLAQPGSALFDAVEVLGMTAVTDSAESGVVRIVGANGSTPSGWQFVPDTAAVDDVLVFVGGWTVTAPRAGALVAAHNAGAAGTGDAASTGNGIAAWRDGALAGAVTGADACTITTAFDPDDDGLTLSPYYPELIRHLVSGCAAGRTSIAGAPLDSGAVRTLRGTGDAFVRAADLPIPPPGRRLDVPLLLLALFCAVAEWGLRRRNESSTTHSAIGAGV